MNKNRITAVSLSLLMVLSMVTGCGNSTASTEKATEKTTEKATEKITEKTTEKITEKATEKTTEKAKEEETEKETEAANSASATLTDTNSDRKINVGIDLFYRRDEYYVDLENSFKSYGAEKGYNIQLMDADADATTQISQIEDFITQGVDVILLSATDPDALAPSVEEATKKGIPVIAYDGQVNSDLTSTQCIFDFYEDGEQVGNWTVDYINNNLDGKAKIAVVDFPASPIVCGKRAQGFIDTVSKLDGVEIVAQQDGKATRTDSMSVVENILTANPDVDIVYGINYDTAAGAKAAIESANSDAIVVCNGWASEGFEQLQKNDPILKCMVASSPVTQAHDALDAVDKAIKGEELPKETMSHSTLVDSTTVNDLDWKSVVEARQG